jgi:CHAD domain-containing protein
MNSRPAESWLRARLVGVQKELNRHGAANPQIDDRWVHLSRREMKRLRAALRLQRAALGTRLYRAANREVRDAARPLTSLRDAAALLEALGELMKGRSRSGSELPVEDVKRLLLAELASNRDQLVGGSLRRGAERLAKLSERLRIARTRKTDLKSARRGVRQVYRNGRAARAAAVRRPSPKTLHEWRKQSVYLSNEAALMREWFGAKLKKIQRQAKELGSLLGDDHDLMLLKKKLKEFHARGLLNEGGLSAFKKKIEKRRAKLQARSFEVGGRLYGPSAVRFSRAIKRAARHSAAK